MPKPKPLRLGNHVRDRNGRDGELISLGQTLAKFRTARGATVTCNVGDLSRAKPRRQPAPEAIYAEGAIVLALEPVLKKEWIKARVASHDWHYVEFLEHPIWKGAKTTVSQVKPFK